MKTWELLQRLAACMVGVLFTINTANAESFADSFRDFVLGSEAQARTITPADFGTNSQSGKCMQCHDSIHLKRAGTPMQFQGNASTNHPVGMSYAQHANKSPATYVRPASLNHRIQLENGQVGCVSCHQAKTTESVAVNTPDCTSTKELATGHDQTSLCMSCHVM